MRRLLLLSAVLASACAGPAVKPPAPEKISENERRFFDDRLLVVERDDAGGNGLYISQTTVLAASPELKARGGALLKAAFPKTCGGETGPGSLLGLLAIGGLDCPEVETLDDYLAGLSEGYARNKADFEKANPGKSYPWPDDGTAKTRAELAPLLRGRDYLVLRYIHVEDGPPKP